MNDLISRQAAIDAVKFGITYAKAINKSTGEEKELFEEGNKALNKAVERLKELPSAQEWILFAHWVAKEVSDEENWDTNSISFPEIACRKLSKLGIIDTDGEKWIYTPPKEAEK